MPEVVPAGELGVRGFDDIGALEGIKTTLKEVRKDKMLCA